MCSYWRSRFSVHGSCGIGPLPFSDAFSVRGVAPVSWLTIRV